MAITSEQRLSAQQTMSEDQRYLYEDPASGIQLLEIARKYNLSEAENYSPYVRMIGDLILGFYKFSDMMNLIQNTLPAISTENRLGLELAIRKFLAPLITEVDTSRVSPTVVPTVINDNLDSDIVETEKALETLHGLRTMSGDMRALRPQEEITYTASSQADILKPPPIAPSNTPTNSPRWDTEA